MTEKGTKEEGKIYEIGFHILPFVGDQAVSNEVGEIKNLLDSIKAVIVSEAFPRLRPLAYPLSKVVDGGKKVCKEAYFGWIKFEAEGEALEVFKKGIEKMPNILRFLIVKTVAENTLYGNKFLVKEPGKAPTKKDAEDAVAPEIKEEINPEELDKSIDELVV